MAQVDPTVIEITTDMLTNVKSGPQTLAIIKGYNPDHSSSTYLNTLSLVNDFASMVTKNKVLSKTAPGLSAAILVDDSLYAIDMYNKNNKLSDSTLLSLASDTIALIGATAAIVGSSSVLVPLGLVAATGLAVWATFSDDSSSVWDTYSSLFDDLSGTYNTFSDTDRTNMAMMLTGGGMPWNYSDGVVPKDPNPPIPRRDPLVLDTDKDGFISTIALKDSNTYFDITGDGIKEKVSWIGANDGILAYDKNGNGKIDGIDEVFGNLTTSGFDELKQLIDSNHDGKIDRRDELFNRLRIWHDNNGDGISQKEELVSLKDEGIKSIDVENVVTTDKASKLRPILFNINYTFLII